MKIIKKITEGILMIIACLAFVMMLAEAETIWMQALSSLGSLGVLAVCCRLIEKIDPDIVKEDEGL